LFFSCSPCKIFSSDSGMYSRYFDPHNNSHQVSQETSYIRTAPSLS
jgi:hypothetical protein